jgi:hypothetical protein
VLQTAESPHRPRKKKPPHRLDPGTAAKSV